MKVIYFCESVYIYIFFQECTHLGCGGISKSFQGAWKKVDVPALERKTITFMNYWP